MAKIAGVWLILAIAILPGQAASTFDGRFYLSKATYAAGEPVYLVFEVTNTSKQTVRIKTANPTSFCGDYRIEVADAKPQDPRPCFGGFGGSCASSNETLLPGQTHTDRILLNQSYDLRRPGQYSVRVSHWLLYSPDADTTEFLLPNDPSETFDAELEVVLEPATNDALKADFQPYLSALKSKDPRQRNEAAAVLAYLAPVDLQPTILGMLKSDELREYGLRGLRNLGTPEAHDALANYVNTAKPDPISSSYQNALRYLGDIGTRDDLPVLMAAAHLSPPESYNRELAMASAAQAGGDDALTALTDEIRDSSKETQAPAVRALGLTGSREAVPVLIQLLRSPDPQVAGAAEFGLQELTHHHAAEATSPSATYAEWARWWKMSGDSPPIYRWDECGDVTPLN